MRRALVVGLLAACAALIACGPVPAAAPSNPGTTTLPTHRDLSGGPAALQSGTIIRSGACVFLQEPVQQLKWLIVWPSGYQLRDQVIVSADGQQIARVGDKVDLGGGEYHEAQYSFLKTLLVTEPSASCRGGDYWFTTEITRP